MSNQAGDAARAQSEAAGWFARLSQLSVTTDALRDFRDWKRDETNAADNEWSYSTVPDRAFTVARVHGADTVSRRAAATTDTLIVDW